MSETMMIGVADKNIPQIEETSILKDKVDSKELLKELIKPKYRMRKITNRGAVLVIIWNFLSWSTFS